MYTVHKSFKEYLPNPVSESFHWLPVTPLEIEDMLKSNDQKKACGHDNLPVKHLVDSVQYISNPLSYIFNVSVAARSISRPTKGG